VESWGVDYLVVSLAEPLLVTESVNS